MQPDQQLTFDRYRLDLTNAQLWRGKRTILLTSQTFAVLRYLVEHAGQVVSKAELFDSLWPGTAVSDGALTFCIVEIRKALGDNARTPRFIETMHRRGYRFIAPLSTTPRRGLESRVHHLASKEKNLPGYTVPTLDPRRQTLDTHLVGREPDLAQLHQWLENALRGARQLVFVTGEPGIGKTTLVETFLHSLASRIKASPKSQVRGPRSEPAPSPQSLAPGLWVAVGQCIEQYGPGEPYMPILEALGRLCRGPDGEQLITLLTHHAPTWLVQLPSLLNGAELETLQRKTAGATRERMLRELGEALDAITAERPFVLWLEDLHWSDASTLELLALLARRREPARLLVIGTYRPVDVIVQEHPLRTVKQELQLHGLCAELPLGLLSEAQVAEYLEQRFGAGAHDHAPLHALAKAIHRRTDGNPLFMVIAVEDLLSQGALIASDGQFTLPDDLAAVARRVPDTLQHLIERQIERLSPEERHLLEVASVVGMEFSAAAVAAGLALEVEAVEEGCGRLAQQERFLRANGAADWPDGTVAARYSFLHALYQEVLYTRIAATRRRRLHQRIGECEEQAYGERVREIAAELAVHFEQGRDYGKAVQYRQQAGKNAVHHSAYHEAITHLTTGLQLLQHLPDTPGRIQQELTLQVTLGPALLSLKGLTAPEVEQTYVRALALCQWSERLDLLLKVLGGLRAFYLVRGDVRKAQEVAEQRLQLAQRVAPLPALVLAHTGVGETLSYQGEFPAARTQLEHAWRLYRAPEHNDIQHWEDTGMLVLFRLALALCVLGYPDQAQQRFAGSLAVAEELSQPVSLAFIWCAACWFYSFHGEWQHVRDRAEAVIQLAIAQGFPYWLAYGTALRGRALAEQGQVDAGIAQIQQGLASFQTTGAELARLDHLPWLAAAYAKGGRVEEGLAALTEALTLSNNTEARSSEAELYRLKGTLTLQSQASLGQVLDKSKQVRRRQHPAPSTQAEAEAETCFLKAIEIARRQQAKSLELRATVSLTRLRQQQVTHHAPRTAHHVLRTALAEAHRMLSEVYHWFTEGFDTKDLQEAKALLAALEK